MDLIKKHNVITSKTEQTLKADETRMGIKQSTRNTILIITIILTGLIVTVFTVLNITLNTPEKRNLPNTGTQASSSQTMTNTTSGVPSEWFDDPNSEKVHTADIIFPSTTLKVDVAVTPVQQMNGLGYTESLPENRGMLFVWSQLTTPVFNTVHMNYNIDIIWVDQNNTIVGFVENVSPHPEKTYNPYVPVDKVIETNAGYVDKHDIQKGQKIVIKPVN